MVRCVLNVDREVAGVPSLPILAFGHHRAYYRTYIGEVYQRHNEPIEEHEASNDVDLCPPRDDEGIADEADLCPIKSNDTHSQTRVCAEQGVDRLVARRDPAHPRKGTESQKEKP